MQNALNDKDSEIKSLSAHIMELENWMNSSVPSAELDEAKKKIRQLTSQYQAMKTELKVVVESKQDLENLLIDKERTIKKMETGDASTLSDKLNKSNRRISELLNQNLELKNELLVVQKCLKQEVGENVKVSQILSDTSSWRGRADQIAKLKRKIVELKEMLNLLPFNSSFQDSESLSNLEIIRDVKVACSKEVCDYKTELDGVKEKCSNLKERNLILKNNIESQKAKIFSLLEKSSRDEEFIKCLNAQISMTKYEHNYKINELLKDANQAKKKLEEAENEVRRLQCQILNQQDLMAAKDEELESHKIAIDQLENNVRDISGDFLFSCREMSKEEYAKILTDLESEKNNLLNFMQQLNSRLDEESQKVCQQHDTITKQRVQITRLEGKINEMTTKASRSSVSSKRQSNSSLNSNSNTTEIDKYKFGYVDVTIPFCGMKNQLKFSKIISRFESATERINFLEKMLRDQRCQHQQDNQRLIEIIKRSKEMFQHAFGNETATMNTTNASECLDTTKESFADQ